MTLTTALLSAACLLVSVETFAASLTVRMLPERGRPGFAEVRGVAAGPFDPAIWSDGPPHLLPDARFPLIEPLPGRFRNIYAPSAVETPGGWRVFYGAWDGVETPNDRIYSVQTKDFLTFSDRHTVIEHGSFVHVCNVNAIRLPEGSFAMACTAYPVGNNTNKTAVFFSPDGRKWNGNPAPHPACAEDLISMEGYPGFEGGDFNGMNVLLYEDGKYRLWFGDFKDFGKTWRATSSDGRHFVLDGKSLDGPFAVNDVKKFRTRDGRTWYLMGLHWNQDRLWYSLSRDGMTFEAAKELGRNLSREDRYIVAHGWVVSGDQEKSGRRLLGYLYGAGAASSLDRNRIFARWLQKKAVFVTECGERTGGTRALGPDRQLIPIADRIRGRILLYAEDGKTLLGRSEAIVLESGKVYRLEMAPPVEQTSPTKPSAGREQRSRPGQAPVRGGTSSSSRNCMAYIWE
jgi:hypothetical protein